MDVLVQPDRFGIFINFEILTKILNTFLGMAAQY